LKLLAKMILLEDITEGVGVRIRFNSASYNLLVSSQSLHYPNLVFSFDYKSD